MQPIPTTMPTEDQPSNIAALPTPDEKEVLREKLKAAEAEVTKLRVSNDDLRERVKAHEENPFSYTMANIDAGAKLIEAGQKLQTLSTEVLDRQEKGTFTLKIVVKPFKGEALVLVSDVTITPPKKEPVQSIFYASTDGRLSRNDPRQREFGWGNRD